MSAMPKVVLAPRRLSGNRPKQPRNDPRRDSSGRMRTRNPISGWLRIPYFNLKRKFTLRVALWTHRRYRERDSIALRTAAAECDQARIARDPAYDGRFYTGVRTTRIYCRPVCPVRPARPANVSFYPTAAAAEAAGFRPFLRCR